MIKRKLAALFVCAALISGVRYAGAFRTSLVHAAGRLRSAKAGISIDMDCSELQTACGLLPGDETDLSFFIRNTGDIPMDITPVVTVECPDGLMRSSSGFEIVTTDTDVYEPEYYLDGEPVKDRKKGSWDTAVYRLKEPYILAGRNRLPETDAYIAGAPDCMFHRIRLRLLPDTESSFMGTAAHISVSADAVQHISGVNGGAAL